MDQGMHVHADIFIDVMQDDAETDLPVKPQPDVPEQVQRVNLGGMQRQVNRPLKGSQ